MMRVKRLPVSAMLASLEYDPGTGKICRAGEETFNTRNGRGYLTGSFEGESYLAHRVAWCLHTGHDPAPNVIDHINGDTADNRLENLRLATQQQNLWNMRPKNNGKMAGANYDPKRDRWTSKIRLNGKQTYLGTFGCETAAGLAYAAAARVRHPEFCVQ